MNRTDINQFLECFDDSMFQLILIRVNPVTETVSFIVPTSIKFSSHFHLGKENIQFPKHSADAQTKKQSNSDCTCISLHRNTFSVAKPTISKNVSQVSPRH
jgi:hypothetical protein